MIPLANHLWQSTLFAAAAGLLTLALRKYSARVRHGVWIVASLKFFLPFSLLIALGSQIPWRTAASPNETSFSIAIEQVGQPFTTPTSFSAGAKPDLLPAILYAAWICGFMAIAVVWLIRWRRIRTAVRAGSPVQLGAPIKAISSPTLLEPGVFGVFRPILLLPEGIAERLTPAQFKAVLAHELCHVRHRDNLVAALHMFIETVFWFHPLVWWIGKRMVEERERACDEEVLRMTGEPSTYAEGILNVCKLYTASPLTCVAGVTGSDLKKRIEAIMTNRTVRTLSRAQKALLGFAGVAVVTAPFLIGLGSAPPIQAQSPDSGAPHFEAASVKPSKDPAPGGDINITPGRFRGKDLALQWLILTAYRIKSGNLSGDLPNWTISERYDIDATTGDSSGEDKVLLALQTLLQDRFKLRMHREMKDEPVYFLTIDKNGPKMPAGNCVPVKKDFPNECWSQGATGLVRTLDWRGVRMSDPGGVAYRTLAGQLSSTVRRTVIDKTGLSGTFNVYLKWASDPAPSLGDPLTPAPAADPSAPSIFDALKEQLGLRLEPGRGPAEYLVVDHAERPSAN